MATRDVRQANVTLTLSRPKLKITTDALRAPNPG